MRPRRTCIICGIALASAIVLLLSLLLGACINLPSEVDVRVRLEGYLCNVDGVFVFATDSIGPDCRATTLPSDST